MTELSRIEIGNSVVRDSDGVGRPFVLSMCFCRIMKEELRKIKIHDL